MLGSRIKAALLGLLTALLLLELTIRTVGGIPRWQQWLRNRSLQGSEVRVAAFGESTTYVGGDWAWPAQLQGQLQEALPGTRVAVYNCGAPGVNTNYLVGHLDEQVRQLQPHFVVSMMGANDSGKQIPFTSLEQPPRAWQWELRSYRMLCYLAAMRLPEAGRLPVASEDDIFAKPALDPDPISSRPRSWALMRAQSMACNGDLRSNLPYLEQAIVADPDDMRPYFLLAERVQSTQGDMRHPIELLQQLLRRYPKDAAPYVALACADSNLADSYYRQAVGKECVFLCKNPHLASSYIAFLEREKLDDEATRFFACIDRNAPSSKSLGMAHSYWVARHRPERAAPYEERLRRLHDCFYIPETRDNYVRMARKSRELGFQLVCASYANRSTEGLRAMLSGESGVTLVDNQEPFHGYIQQGRYDELFTDHCYGDLGHATPLGNRLIAQNIARALLRLGLGGAPPPQPPTR